jgi:hypothetical protein
MLSTRAHSFDARARSLALVAERWPTDDSSTAGSPGADPESASSTSAA